MAEGIVRWFNSERGYGFILPDGGGAEVRVHYSEIQTNGYKSLDPGERVSFDVAYGPNGLRAVTVTPLGEIVDPADWPSPGGAAARGPARRTSTWRRVLSVLCLLLAVVAFVTFIVFVIRGEEIGALFLLLALGLGGLGAVLDGT